MIYKNAINEQHVGNSHVYQADCMDLLKQTPGKYYDLCVCDPPYGININMNMGRRKGKKKKHEEKGWDAHPPNEDYLKSNNMGGQLLPFTTHKELDFLGQSCTRWGVFC